MSPDERTRNELKRSGEASGAATRREVWTIADRRFDLTWPADMDALLDAAETQRRFAQDEYMPYWAQPWPASVLLATEVLRGAPGQGGRAIELGCGIGLVSIAAAMAGWSVVATDYETRAIEFASENARRSGVSLAGTAVLDYRIPLDSPQYDLVLGSDLLYERKKAAPVADWIASAIKPAGVAMVSDPNRSAADGFMDDVARCGLRCVLESREMMSPSGLQVRGRIWRITR